MKSKKLVLFFLSTLFFFSSDGFCLEYPSYDIKATLDVERKTLQAQETITWVNNSSDALEAIYFHIYPNRKYSPEEISFILRYGGYFKVNPFPDGFQETKVDIESVTDEKGSLSFNIEGEDKTLLKVSLANPLLPGETIKLNIHFSQNIPHAYGRYGWHENIITLSRWYPVLSVYDEKGWNNHPFYPFHRPFFSEASHYKIELTLPQDQVVIHSGQLKEERPSKNNQKVLQIETKHPVREFSLAMSPDYKLIEEKTPQGVVKSYYLPQDEGHAQLALEVVKDLMNYYAGLFGKYPYDEFSIAPVYLGYGGEQMSNLIYIDTRVYKLPRFLDRYFDFLIAHETGHQWFYNLVGIDEYREIWLEEGIHSYFISEYLEGKYGLLSFLPLNRTPNLSSASMTPMRDLELERKSSIRADVINTPHWLKSYKWLLPELTFQRTRDVRYKTLSRIGFDSAVVSDLSSFQEPSTIFALTYGKGSAIVRMLKEVMGEEAFLNTFKRIFEEYQFKNFSVNDFMRLCEEQSGRDLDSFFSQWLKSKEHFDAAVTGVKGNQIMLANKGGILMPVEVEIEYKGGNKKNMLWSGEGLNVQAPEDIKRIVIDPQEKTLDLDRTNNHWPRKILVKPVPFYWPLYDHALFLPEDSYNVVIGPEASNGGLGVKASLQKPYEANLYAATDYEFGEAIGHSRVGFQLNNIFHKQVALGFEVANQTDFDDGEEDLVSGKVFLRRELWPAQYGLFDTNDHVSLYLIRNRSLGDTLLFGGKENTDNVSYLRKDEAITGVNFHLGRYGPYPDPREGYQVDALLENSGHFLEATQYFTRGALDISWYHPVCPKSTLAARFKLAGGFPDDKNLFELGGPDGLRGYGRKEIRGANAFLGSMEYRFLLKEKINAHALDNILSLEALGAVVFVEGGESWYSSLPEADFKKDAGVGLRATVNIGSFLEKVILRADVAQALNDGSEDPHFWFGLNHAF